MNAAVTSDSLEVNQLPDIQSEQLRITFSAVPLTLLAVLITSAIFSYIQWDIISHTAILIWFCAINSLSVIRLALLLKFNTLDSKEKIPVIWKHITLGTSIVSGMMWGSLAFWLFPADNIAYQAFTTFIIAGICAGAVTTLSSILSSSVSFIVISTAPFIAQFYLMDSTMANAMCVMTILFTISILVTSKKFNDTIKDSLLIRQERMLAERTIQHQAHYDALTNLPNRRLLIERLKHEIDYTVRHKQTGAVMFLDLDRFKTINDSLGHAIGDELLQQVASRLSNRMRKVDSIARLGGDEFIVLVSDLGNTITEITIAVDKVTRQILKLFEQPFYVGEHKLHTSVSIGITTFSTDKTSPEELLQKSDVAMYEAKEAGRNTSRVFLPEMQRVVNNRQTIVKDLHRALDDGEFELYYQPQVDVNNNIFEVEALLRWNHPEKGLLGPDDFIEIAENNGFIVDIGEWVLKTACEQLSKINDNDNDDISISINVSPRQFEEPSFVDTLKKVISETAVDPKKVRLEITENLVLKSLEETIEKMQLLRSMGIHFSIDDFGTGYSSLAYLKRLPVDILKIDKSFVLDVITDPNDAIIVETIILMARNMQIGVVAEGVENEEILEFLKSKGCDKFQGYMFSRPLPIQQLISSFNDHTTHTADTTSKVVYLNSDCHVAK